MNRPTERPITKYTPTTFLNAAYQHFVTDKSPRCIGEDGMCEYTGTGCFIGFVLTEEDSNKMSESTLDLDNIKSHREILSHYFDLSDDTMTRILYDGQEHHDDFRVASDGDFVQYITKAIESLRSDYAA